MKSRVLDGLGHLSYPSLCGSVPGDSPLAEREGGTIKGTRLGAKGAGQMRTLRELESDIEISDPLTDQSLDPGGSGVGSDDSSND